MTALKILIVEDNTINAAALRETLEGAGHTVTAMVSTFDLVMKALQLNPPDLALIDIHLGKDDTGKDRVNGIEMAKELTRRHRMPIIYLTGNNEPDTFRAAKETLPAAYLLKPFRPDELTLQVELAYYYFQATGTNPSAGSVPGPLYLPVEGGHEKIDLKDVLYVKADGSYTMVFLADEQKYDKSKYYISMNLSNLAQYFTTANFHRLSRSYLVNLDYIKRLKDDCLYLVDNKTVLPIPATNRRELLRKLTIVRTK